MMPPVSPLPIPTGDVAPYPDEALALGGGRWLTIYGKVTTHLRGQYECELTSQTLRFWETAALKGEGVPLQDLIV